MGEIRSNAEFTAGRDFAEPRDLVVLCDADFWLLPAQSLSGEPVVTAPFLVAVATRGTPQLTSVSQPGAGQVQIAWNSQSNSTPCLVRVNALPFSGTVLADSVVACALHSFTFTGLPLVANGSSK